MRDVLKQAGFLFLFVVLLWFTTFFLIGSHYCSTTEVINGKTIDTGKIQCHFNPPEKFNLTRVFELTPT